MTEYHTSSTHLQSRSASATDVLFRIMCAIHGVHTGFEKNRLLQGFTVLFWFASQVFSSLPTQIETLREDFATSQKGEVVYKFVDFMQSFVFTATILYSIIRFVMCHDEFEAMLQRDRRHFRDVALHIFCNTVFLAAYVAFLAKSDSIGSVLSATLYSFLQIPCLSFFLMYNDAIYGLHSRQENILSLTTNIRAHRQKIMAEKRDLRRLIKRANKFFRFPMTSYYALNFIWMVFSVVKVAKINYSYYETLSLFLCQVSFLIQLFKIVADSSSLNDKCRDTEQKLLEQLQDTATQDKECLKELLLVVRFRKDWDALQVGYTSMRNSHFLNFVITNVTCTAVVLQFA